MAARSLESGPPHPGWAAPGALDRVGDLSAKVITCITSMLVVRQISGCPSLRRTVQSGRRPATAFPGAGPEPSFRAGVGTFFAAIAAHTRAREVLLPLLLFPVQVLIFCDGGVDWRGHPHARWSRPRLASGSPRSGGLRRPVPGPERCALREYAIEEDYRDQWADQGSRAGGRRHPGCRATGRRGVRRPAGSAGWARRGVERYADGFLRSSVSRPDAMGHRLGPRTVLVSETIAVDLSPPGSG